MHTEDLHHSRPTLPKTTPGDDPLLRLHRESEPDDSPQIQTTNHAEPLTITGITVMCPNCSARRDWLIICDVRSWIFLRCRCAHQWHEPELNRDDFERMAGAGGHKYPSLEAIARDTGYDGMLAGAYLDTCPRQ